MAEQPIIIIGAGIGGLSSAIRLQAAGHHVIVLEKNALVGGKMYLMQQDGFHFDTGPSVITMRHVFEDLFAAAGRRLENYLTLLPADPLTRYFYRDGTVLDASSDMGTMAQAIADIEPRDVEGYFSYLGYAARIHRITGPVFIYDQPPTLKSFTKVAPPDWLKADTFRTMQAAIRSHVKSPKLRQLLGRFATYVGGSPYDAPATLNVISHVELVGGVWYPQGGIYQIALALEKLARELGVEICTEHPVRQINVQAGRATGVTLEDGAVMNAKAVISNADVTTTLKHMMPKGSVKASRLQHLSNYEPSCSGFVLLLGVDKEHPQLAHHNVFFSDDYKAEFAAIFKQALPPDDPTIYVSISSKTDADHAPAGSENWFVLVNAPALSDAYDWSQNAQAYRDRVLRILAEKHGIDIRDHIRTETILTPQTLADMSGAWRGALYGPSANNRFTVFMRPHNRSKDVRGLYFAGGTTHPGGGVPMVMLSGKVAADMVQHDLQHTR